VGVGLRLGLSLCVPYLCQCGSLVSSTGVHSFVCKKAPGRTARHHALNDLIARTLVSTGIPVTKEPNDLSRSDGKRPDGLTLVPCKEGKPLTWDATVVCTVADSYVSGSAREAGTAAKTATQRLQWIVQCFTSSPTQYRLYGIRVLQVKRPNQQYQSTEGDGTAYRGQVCNSARNPSFPASCCGVAGDR